MDNILQKNMNLIFVSDEKNIDFSPTKIVEKNEILDILWDQEKTNLNMSYTFENYFYSYENRNIIEGAKHIINEITQNCKEPSFNPFFLYGSRSLGGLSKSSLRFASLLRAFQTFSTSRATPIK